MSRQYTRFEEEAISRPLNDCHVKIEKLSRNRDLMLAFLCVVANQRADKTLEELRRYLANNGGYVEEV